MMDESRYNQLVASLFKKLLAALDEVDPDEAETDATADMLTITAANGEKCIVNTQRAVRQIWVAGTGQGIHFTYDERTGQWRDDKGRGLEVLAFVSEVVQDLTGHPLRYA
ncbi:MAG TPA: iron donor protein CyaY [Myxococcaceae bacterium]|nr:iron donor protein CyaY [Myxococcaceae bacterium]